MSIPLYDLIWQFVLETPGSTGSNWYFDIQTASKTECQAESLQMSNPISFFLFYVIFINVT